MYDTTGERLVKKDICNTISLKLVAALAHLIKYNTQKRKRYIFIPTSTRVHLLTNNIGVSYKSK